MDIEKIQGRKKIWLAVMAAAIVSGAAFFYAGTAEEEAMPAPAKVSGTEKKTPSDFKGRQEIAGWQKAEETKAVRNPFSLRHETAEEKQQDVPETPKETKEKPAGKIQQPAPNFPEVQQASALEVPAETEDVSAIPAPVLKGLMEGERGRMAMVQIAGKTAALSVGETFQDCTVLAIEENSIIMENKGQERQLFLPGY